MIEPGFALWFWGFLFLYGGLMYAITPRARTVAGFFRGTDDAGRPASGWALTCSIFIRWIFAKSVTNAANPGAAYGAVGGLAYATYWLSIPFAGPVRIDALAVEYDHDAWLRDFRRNWPPGHESYHRRIVEGPGYDPRAAPRWRAAEPADA